MSRKYKNKINNNTVNIDYLSKDFISLKGDLINFAKAYFPDTYNDFNETSPGMMLMEMSAYVGDILSYYIDHQSGRDRDATMTSVWLGPKGALKRRALTSALEYAGR